MADIKMELKTESVQRWEASQYHVACGKFHKVRDADFDEAKRILKYEVNQCGERYKLEFIRAETDTQDA
jgi:hypothetical protein